VVVAERAAALESLCGIGIGIIWWGFPFRCLVSLMGERLRRPEGAAGHRWQMVSQRASADVPFYCLQGWCQCFCRQQVVYAQSSASR